MCLYLQTIPLSRSFERLVSSVVPIPEFNSYADPSDPSTSGLCLSRLPNRCRLSSPVKVLNKVSSLVYSNTEANRPTASRKHKRTPTQLYTTMLQKGSLERRKVRTKSIGQCTTTILALTTRTKSFRGKVGRGIRSGRLSEILRGKGSKINNVHIFLEGGARHWRVHLTGGIDEDLSRIRILWDTQASQVAIKVVASNVRRPFVRLRV